MVPDFNPSYVHATSDYINPSNSRIIGLCTGMLAAVAASSFRSFSDLPTLGTALVRIAFRVGVVVAGSRERLQQGPRGQASWAVAVAESNEDRMKATLRQFHIDKVRPETTALPYAF